VIAAFIDTNVLLYAASSEPTEAAKAKAARELIQGVEFGTSVQVLQEFYVNASGKLAAKISPQHLQEVIRLLKEQPIASISVETFEEAIALSIRFHLSYWDSAIIAAARSLGAKTIYSEDLSHGQLYDGIIVVNPFKDK
jgi:predicted nucleic acid-binding protein